MEDLGGVLIAVGVTLLLGFGVGAVLGSSVPKPMCPKYFDQVTWDAMYEAHHGGPSIGVVERLICLMSFYLGEYVIVGGYLAFKVAAKWEAWRNVIQVPENLRPAISPTENNIMSAELAWYQVRLAYGSWLLSRFIVGTGLSVLTAAVGAYLGKHFTELALLLSRMF